MPILRPDLSGSVFGATTLAVPLLEAFDTTGGIDDLHLPGEEGMAGAGQLNLRERVLVAIFPCDSFTCRNCGAGEDREVGGRVLKHDWAVVGVDSVLHSFSIVVPMVDRTNPGTEFVGVQTLALPISTRKASFVLNVPSRSRSRVIASPSLSPMADRTRRSLCASGSWCFL